MGLWLSENAGQELLAKRHGRSASCFARGMALFLGLKRFIQKVNSRARENGNNHCLIGQREGNSWPQLRMG